MAMLSGAEMVVQSLIEEGVEQILATQVVPFLISTTPSTKKPKK